LHEAHAQHQRRFNPAIERRRGHYSVWCGACSCHGPNYTAARNSAGQSLFRDLCVLHFFSVAH
jgi:hypothetical protein